MSEVRLAFLFYGNGDTRYPLKMLDSVRRSMPEIECLQLTDETTPAVGNATTIRLPRACDNPTLFRMEHLSRLHGPLIVIDTDVAVLRDMRHVFAFEFDMALTWRDGPIYDPDGNDLVKIMPINCGVMFQRNPRFWNTCLEWCTGKNVGWYADQLAVAANWSRFDVLRLHCDNFNYTPRSPVEDVSMRHAVHYKGKRKEWML